MPDNSANNKRIAKNTLILYGRMLLTVGISFYTTRLILANLGVEDYGVYNVIGGFVSMFYMVTSTLTQAVGRFLTFDLGVGDTKKLQQTFSTSFIILLALAFFVVLLAETIGLWFVNNKLNIDPARMVAANWVYQFSVISFVLEMLSVPYSASVISHEKMGTFAFVTIAKVLLHLLVAVILSVTSTDKLILYGILMLGVSFSIQMMYYIYCTKNFQECRLIFKMERERIKPIFGFAGWNFLTTCAAMLSSQGVNILMNMHFGVVVNAAQGVAAQIKGTASAFSKNFSTAVSPQITKSYAHKDFEYTKILVCQGAKFQYLLLLVVALPIILETPFILEIWLKEVPEFATGFVRLSLLYSLVDMLVGTSDTLNNATGDIRNYQILNSITQFAILLASYIALDLGSNPILTYSITNIGYALIVIPRILLNRKYCGITLSYWANTVFYRVLVITIMAVFPCILVQGLLVESWSRLVMIGFLSTGLIGFGTFWLALNRVQRKKAYHIIFNRVKKRYKAGAL